MNTAGCQCDRCMKKTPREGFYKAPPAMHESAAALQTDLDYWLESRVGYDPKIGNPDLDNTFERLRTPAMLKALLAKTKARYPRAFNAGKPEFVQDQKPIGYTESDPEVLQEMRDRMAAKIADRDAWREAAQ